MSAFEDFIQLELPRRPWVVDNPAEETIPVRRGAGPRQLEFITLADGEVVGKVSGTIQGVAVPGLGGGLIPKNYVHTQSVLSAQWNINHALSSSDWVVVVFDENDEIIIPDRIDATDADNVTIDFNTGQIGKAVFIFAS